MNKLFIILVALVLLCPLVSAQVTTEQPRVLFYGIMIAAGVVLFFLGEISTPFATIFGGMLLVAAAFYGSTHIIDESAQVFHAALIGFGLFSMIRGALKLSASGE